LHLRGVDLGDRWQGLANSWAPMAGRGAYAFNDVHAVMAFVGAGRRDLARTVIEQLQEAVARPGDNARFAGDVGLPVARALVAFSNRDYAQVTRLLRSVRSIACRFGGSHAQRDVIDLTLIEAAI